MGVKNRASEENINKRGAVKKSLIVIIIIKNNIKINYQKKEDKTPVGPLLLGIFLFVVVGSGNLIIKKILIFIFQLFSKFSMLLETDLNIYNNVFLIYFKYKS